MKHFKCMESMVVPRSSYTRNRSPYAISVFFRSWLLVRVISRTLDIKTLWIVSLWLSLLPRTYARNSSRKEYRGDILSIIEGRIYVRLIKLKFHLWEWEIDFSSAEGTKLTISYFSMSCRKRRSLSSSSSFTAYIVRLWSTKLLVSQSLESIPLNYNKVFSSKLTSAWNDRDIPLIIKKNIYLFGCEKI